MRVNAITGMKIDENLKRDNIIATLAKFGDEYSSPSDDITTETLAVSLFSYYTNSLPKERQIRCNKCGGIGDNDDDLCPYCGHNEGTDILDSKPEAKKTMTTESETTVKDDKKAKKNGASKAVVVDDTKLSSALRSERDLDAAVAKVRRAQSDASLSGWQLGKYIADIKDNDLWKLRTHKDGKSGKERPRWSSWEAFCTTELGMTPRNALGFANVASKFTEEQVKAVGMSKLQLVLQAAPEDRKEMEKLAESGAPARQIRAHVKKSRAKSKSVVKGRASAATEAAAKSKAKKSKTITVASVLGSVNVKLFKKPASLKDFDPEKATRARKLADEPFGQHELSNGVIQFFYVSESPSGELVLKVVSKRDE
jgi:hypothetical protein